MMVRLNKYIRNHQYPFSLPFPFSFLSLTKKINISPLCLIYFLLFEKFMHVYDALWSNPSPISSPPMPLLSPPPFSPNFICSSVTWFTFCLFHPENRNTRSLYSTSISYKITKFKFFLPDFWRSFFRPIFCTSSKEDKKHDPNWRSCLCRSIQLSLQNFCSLHSKSTQFSYFLNFISNSFCKEWRRSLEK